MHKTRSLKNRFHENCDEDNICNLLKTFLGQWYAIMNCLVAFSPYAYRIYLTKLIQHKCLRDRVNHAIYKVKSLIHSFSEDIVLKSCNQHQHTQVLFQLISVRKIKIVDYICKYIEIITIIYTFQKIPNKRTK